MNDTIKVVITIRKQDLSKFVDKFGIEEYHFKKDEINIDMTELFDDAMSQVATKTEHAASDVF